MRPAAAAGGVFEDRTRRLKVPADGVVIPRCGYSPPNFLISANLSAL